ncbi:Fungal specific transcription factor [Pleurostoma richardsiae]|uniref:Fungal specific transcription factor n=1 Tax=Pleurostoma richardsiae TaxID=41990 RepID=A0AA38RST7_9PEZI|nr:Fungal specific transcription factor [Pleurostoma richardsiae]
MLNKSCDHCRNRKVRCLVPPTPPGRPVVCSHCLKRNETCHFSIFQRKLRSNRTSLRPSTSSPDTPRPSNRHEQFPDCFIDRLLQDPSAEAALYDEFSVLKVHDQRVPSSGLAFFSDHKVDGLVQKIGNSRLRELVNAMDIALRSRLLTRADNELARLRFGKGHPRTQITAHEAAVFIHEYFAKVHPVFPFLDREDFEQKAFDVNLSTLLDSCSQYSALYHAVLALGCQHHGGGSFELGRGRAWELFLVSMSYVADIQCLGDSLTMLQALTAMSIFAMNACYLQVDHTLLSEVTRMALRLRYHKSTIDGSQAACRRTFWVIYHMEKHDSFQARSASVIADYDIGCPIPSVPESTFGEYNWFLSSIRFSRILSFAYESLFSLTASTRPAGSQLIVIDHVRNILEQWRESIPVEFRPQQPLHRPHLVDPKTKQVALSTQYYYYHLVIALERLTLHLGGENGTKRQESKRKLLGAARTVIELTRFIDVEPYTPIFILGIMPLSALFILFDFVIHNPFHSDTRSNLTLLDVASGHFSLLEHVSAGLLPGNHLSEFAHIARQYVQELPVPPNEPSRQLDLEQEASSQGGRAEETAAENGGDTVPSQRGCGNDGLDDIYMGDMDASVVSEPLDYPIPYNFAGSTDIQAMAGVDFRTLFSSSFLDLGHLGE